MAQKKRPAKVTKRTTFRFVIDAYSPATIPMERLVAYLTELSTLLGETKSVHFRKLEEGSTVPVVEVEYEAVPKVRDRVEAVRREDAPNDAIQANRNLNRLLREDNATGKLVLLGGKKPLLQFPGKLQIVARPITSHRHSTIDGKLVKIGGTDATLHATLLTDGTQVSGIEMDEYVAKRLAPHFLDFVRLIGQGKWERGTDGRWALKHFVVSNFTTLDNAPLSKALEQIRTIGTGWDDETALEDLRNLRGDGGSDASD